MPVAVRRWLITGLVVAALMAVLTQTTGGIAFVTGFHSRFPTLFRTVTQGPFRLLYLPAALTLLGLREWLGWSPPVDSEYQSVSLLILLVTGVYSYVVWAFFLPRFWKLIGRWNPFGLNIDEMRPYHLKIWVALRQWSERESQFGQHATGGFAGLIEVLSNRYKFGDIFLGRPKLWIGGMLRPIGLPTEKHFVTIAQTGSGKSVAGLVPNLCLHWGSLLCIDPKGELAAITARRRGQGGGGVRGMGQKVYVLNPFRLPMLSNFREATYNVFDEMAKVAQYDPDRPVSYAHKVAQALVPSTSRDPYWDDAPRTFITGLLLYILQGPAAQRNLVRLRQLIMEGDSEAAGAFRSTGGRSEGDAFDALITMMKNAPPGPYQHVITGSANALSMMAPNQRSSVMTMAMQHTSFLDIPEIRRVSMSSDFSLEDLKQENISVYLCLPLNAVSGIESRWLRMFVLLTVDMMTRVQKAPDPPLLLAIDEFPSLGKLDGIEAVAPTMRSQGVRLWVVGQDIKQFEAVYPDSWDSFIGGAEAVQFMGITHPPTVAYIAERLGEHVVTERERQPGMPMRMVKSVRAVRDPEQIARLLAPKDKNQIVWRGNARPMLLKITPYFSYMPWWYYSRDRRFKQKFRQWLWRRGSDPVDFTPQKPNKPDDDLPETVKPSFDFMKEFGRKDIAPPAPLLPPLKPYEPGINLRVSDKIPGTDTTWKEALSRQPGAKLPPKNDPPKPPEKNSDALAELDALIGLTNVKTQVRDTINMLKLSRARAKRGMSEIGVTHHMVFTGNPGTGKTTVARIVGQVYKDIGMLKTGHLIEAERSDLIAGYVGQTGPKTLQVVKQALGGVLFIDEAYSLTPQPGAGIDFAPEAIAALLKAMEDHREELVVIAAGYKEEMGKFIESNPGLKSRFKTIIEFEDYDSGDLFRILNKMAGANGIRLSADAMEGAAFLMEQLDTGKKGFGNGRAVRNIFEECLRRQARRFSASNGKADIAMFERADIPKPGEKDFS